MRHLFDQKKDFVVLAIVVILCAVLGAGSGYFAHVSFFKKPEAKESAIANNTETITSNSTVSKILTKSSTVAISSQSSNQNISSVNSSVASSSSSTPTIDQPKQNKPSNNQSREKDYLGVKITAYLKENGYNLGFIWSEDIVKFGHAMPVGQYLDKVDLDKKNITQPVNLDSLVAKPSSCEKKDWLSFPKYKVEAPVKYASFQDLYNSNRDKTININSPIIEDPAAIARGNYLSVPIQRLLQAGIVHMPESPFPGQVGNSYIVGHTSNFPSVKSNYNYIFKPFERTSKIGDEFWVWDIDCRKMKFRVFDVKNILAEDLETAYKNFGDRRVVTLQGSILDANYQPTRRWLTRGELVLE
jgi:Sortase domain